MSFPGVHWLLSVFHPRLLAHRPSAIRPNQEDGEMALGRSPIQCIRNAKDKNVLMPSTQTTQLQ